MNTDELNSGDERLAALLRGARPAAEVRPGFQRQVWQRIEKSDRLSVSVLDRLAGWLLNPKLAAGALAAVVIISASAGAVRGIQAGDEAARPKCQETCAEDDTEPEPTVLVTNQQGQSSSKSGMAAETGTQEHPSGSLQLI